MDGLPMRARPALAIFLLLISIAVPGCGASSQDASVVVSEPSAEAANDASGPDPMTEVEEESPGRLTAKSIRSVTAPPGQTLLVLESDGIGLVRGKAVRHLRFGAEFSVVSSELGTILGTLARNDHPSCGQGTLTQLDAAGFSALFDSSRFVGWTDTGQNRPKLTTLQGVGVGSTLATLRSRYSKVDITEGLLGPQWVAKLGQPGEPGIKGLLNGTAARSAVTAMFAGRTCLLSEQEEPS
jgi:hypothetical protein